NPGLLLEIQVEFIFAVAGESFTEDNQCRNIPAIHPLDSPVQNLFCRIERGISSLLNITLPIYERTTPTNSINLRDNFLCLAWQKLFPGGLDGIFASQHIPRSQPIESVRVVIRMCVVDGHVPTLARVSPHNSNQENQRRRLAKATTLPPKLPEEKNRTKLLTL